MYLSIIIPIYNTEQYIRQCVLSCIQKVDFDYEIILVNDGTPDDSISQIADLIEKYEFISLYTQKNQGVSVARNTGLKYAKGEYIWFIDSDDWLVDNSMQEIASSIDRNKIYDVIAFKSNYLYENNTVVIGTPLEDKALMRGFDFLQKGPLWSVWRLWYNRKYLIDKNIVFVKGLLHEDNDFNFRTMVFADNVIYVDVVGYNYRPQREGSIMNTVSLKRACTGFEYLYLSEPMLDNGILSPDEITYLSYHCLFSMHWSYFKMYDYLNSDDKKNFRKELSKARGLIVKYIFKSNYKKYHLFIPLVLLAPSLYLKLILYLYKSRSKDKDSIIYHMV